MFCDSLTKFDQPLRLELGFSRWLAATAAVLHGLALLGCLLTPLAAGWRLLLGVLVCVHGLWFLRRQLTATAGRAISGIAWDRFGGWRVRGVTGDWRPARLALPVFVSARLAVVRFRVAGHGTHSALIVPDRIVSDRIVSDRIVTGRVDADAFRRLRVRLLQAAQGRQ